MELQIKEAKVYGCKDDGAREQMQKDIEGAKLVLAFYEKKTGDTKAQMVCHIDLSGKKKLEGFETLRVLTSSFAGGLYTVLTKSIGAEPEVALRIMQHFWVDAQGDVYEHNKEKIDEALDRVHGAEKKEAHA